MAVESTRASVTATATLIAEAVSETGRADGVRLTIYNRGSTAVYLGEIDVTTGDGFQLDADESLGTFLELGERLYGIAGGGTAVVHVMKGGA